MAFRLGLFPDGLMGLTEDQPRGLPMLLFHEVVGESAPAVDEKLRLLQIFFSPVAR